MIELMCLVSIILFIGGAIFCGWLIAKIMEWRYCKGYYVNEIPRIKRAIPVREKIVATKAHRLETVGGIWPGADLDVLKEYLEQHGYQVTIHANVLKEESWSRKSTSVYQGFKMVISWEE